MRQAGVAGNVIGFNAAISACGKGGQWQRALSLLDDMRKAGATMDVISFSAAVSACENGGQWQRASSLLDDMRQAGVRVDMLRSRRVGRAANGSERCHCSTTCARQA